MIGARKCRSSVAGLRCAPAVSRWRSGTGSDEYNSTPSGNLGVRAGPKHAPVTIALDAKPFQLVRHAVPGRIRLSGACIAGTHCACRGRIGRGEGRAGSGTAVDDRPAAENGSRLAHLLAESGRFRIADDTRVDAAARIGRRADRVAGAQRARAGALDQLRLRRHRVAADEGSGRAGCASRSNRNARRACRLAGVPRDLHSGRRRSHACAAGRIRSRRGFALGRRGRDGARRHSRADRRLERLRRRPRVRCRAFARARQRDAGTRPWRAAFLSSDRRQDRSKRAADTRARRRDTEAFAAGREPARRRLHTRRRDPDREQRIGQSRRRGGDRRAPYRQRDRRQAHDCGGAVRQHFRRRAWSMAAANCRWPSRWRSR